MRVVDKVPEFRKFASLVFLTPMRFVLYLSFFLIAGSSFAQSGYRFNFKINGLHDTTAYLAYYYGESTFVRDTARVSTTGTFRFDGDQVLRHGVYFVVLNKTRLFEFVVGEKQSFTLSSDTSDLVGKMVVEGDIDNQLFFDNMRFNMARHKEAEPYIKAIQDTVLSDDEKKAAREAFSKINDKVVDFQDNIIEKHPKTLTARLLKAGKQVKIPDPPTLGNGSIDSTFQLRWYREHFFDNFDLGDDAMIQMPRPLYQQKVNEYLDRLYIQHPDSVWRGIQHVVNLAKRNQETYKYAVWVCVLKYQQPEIMGMDEVYVDLYDAYFASGEMDFWANEKLKKNLKDQADRLRKSLVGRQGANLIMQDLNLKPRELYDMPNKYTILYIFDPDCHACKEETPKLVDFYSKTKFDVGVFAVSADTSMAKMRDYIRDMKMKWVTVNGPRTYVGPYQDLYDANSTPTLYVLDRKKKIIGKKIPSEKLEEFLTQYERIEKARAEGKL